MPCIEGEWRDAGTSKQTAERRVHRFTYLLYSVWSMQMVP